MVVDEALGIVLYGNSRRVRHYRWRHGSFDYDCNGSILMTTEEFAKYCDAWLKNFEEGLAYRNRQYYLNRARALAEHIRRNEREGKDYEENT